MPTEAQINANRANAQHSTGPKTAEGKARVAQNAVRHGLTATYFVVRQDENEEFDQFAGQLMDEVDPQGVLENLTFNELLHAGWGLHRGRRIEEESLRGMPQDFVMPGQFNYIEKLGRYQARCQRAFYRAVAELRKLQTERALRQTQPEQPAVQSAPILADTAKLTKQTQSRLATEPEEPEKVPAVPQLVVVPSVEKAKLDPAIVSSCVL